VKPRPLVNENFPAPSVSALRSHGYDVFAVAEAAKDFTDRQVLALAVAGERWILTFDRDYGELVLARDLLTPPAVIYLRLSSYRPDDPGKLLVELLAVSTMFAGQVVVIEEESLRMRPLPQKRST
jgi:predicted nuclease of predicted toxin-antitoxin system